MASAGAGQAEGDDGDAGNDASADAKSLQCADCGKLLRTSEAAQFHATKTGHVNFTESTAEIKPLTGTD